MNKDKSSQNRGRIPVSVTLKPENYCWLMDYVESETKRGLPITVTRAINALIEQIQYGRPIQDETNYRKRHKPYNHVRPFPTLRRELTNEEVKLLSAGDEETIKKLDKEIWSK